MTTNIVVYLYQLIDQNQKLKLFLFLKKESLEAVNKWKHNLAHETIVREE